MIFDSLKNKDNYKDFPLLYQALCFLVNITEETIPSPNTILIENQLFCNPISLVSKPENQCIYEAHRTYIDLHYIVSGVERISISDITNLSVVTPYNSRSDIEFLEGISDGSYNITPGQFMVCFPSDAHKVGIMKEEPCPIKKIVIKIKAEA